MQKKDAKLKQKPRKQLKVHLFYLYRICTEISKNAKLIDDSHELHSTDLKIFLLINLVCD